MSHNLRSLLRGYFRKPLFFYVVFGFFIGCQSPPQTVDSLRREATGSDISLVRGSRFLDPHTQRSISHYGRIIHKYSQQYDFDWRLILAIMKQESRFKHTARSHRGAYGLMQIMPVTQLELAEKLGVKDATTPYNNIKAGIFHLKTLYGVFDEAVGDDRLCLTLAAYNAGLSRILDAQAIVRFLGGNPNSWTEVRDAFPLLSPRYSSLHKRIWDTGIPRGGYFRGWRQTTGYVENVLQFYRQYKLVLADTPTTGL